MSQWRTSCLSWRHCRIGDQNCTLLFHLQLKAASMQLIVVPGQYQRQLQLWSAVVHLGWLQKGRRATGSGSACGQIASFRHPDPHYFFLQIECILKSRRNSILWCEYWINLCTTVSSADRSAKSDLLQLSYLVSTTMYQPLPTYRYTLFSLK